MSSCYYPNHSTTINQIQMAHYTGIGPCFLHTAGEGRAPKAQGSHDDTLAEHLLGRLWHLAFLLGRLEASGGLLMGQLHMKQLMHTDICLGRGLHEDIIPLQCIGRAISQWSAPNGGCCHVCCPPARSGTYADCCPWSCRSAHNLLLKFPNDFSLHLEQIPNTTTWSTSSCMLRILSNLPTSFGATLLACSCHTGLSWNTPNISLSTCYSSSPYTLAQMHSLREHFHDPPSEK